MDLTIVDVYRTGHVNRWQIVRTLRQQTIAEHMYLVAMTARDVARAVMGPRFTAQEELAILRWALVHDLPEVVTGDIPTPVKDYVRSAYGVDPFMTMDHTISSEFNMANSDMEGSPLMEIAKMADVMEAIAFLHVEGASRHAHSVKTKLRGALHKIVDGARESWPDLNWDAVERIMGEVMAGSDVGLGA